MRININLKNYYGIVLIVSTNIPTGFVKEIFLEHLKTTKYFSTIITININELFLARSHGLQRLTIPSNAFSELRKYNFSIFKNLTFVVYL